MLYLLNSLKDGSHQHRVERDIFGISQTDQRQRYRSAFLPDRYSGRLPWRGLSAVPCGHTNGTSMCHPEPEAPTVHKVILSCSWTCLQESPPAAMQTTPDPRPSSPVPTSWDTPVLLASGQACWSHADSSVCQDKKASCHCPDGGINGA